MPVNSYASMSSSFQFLDCSAIHEECVACSSESAGACTECSSGWYATGSGHCAGQDGTYEICSKIALEALM